MKDDPSLWAKKVMGTADVLRQSNLLAKHNDAEHDEVEAVAHAIWDMNESFKKLTDEIFPRLGNAQLNPEQTKDILWEIRDELKHIVYHVGDCRSFKDLLDD